ncbi:hypothetical protein D3C72_1649050 [compost metagenome]
MVGGDIALARAHGNDSATFAAQALNGGVHDELHPVALQPGLQLLRHLVAIGGALAGGVHGACKLRLVRSKGGLQRHGLVGRYDALRRAAQPALHIELVTGRFHARMGGVEHQFSGGGVIPLALHTLLHGFEVLAAGGGQLQQLARTGG